MTTPDTAVIAAAVAAIRADAGPRLPGREGLMTPLFLAIEAASLACVLVASWGCVYWRTRARESDPQILAAVVLERADAVRERDEARATVQAQYTAIGDLCETLAREMTTRLAVEAALQRRRLG